MSITKILRQVGRLSLKIALGITAAHLAQSKSFFFARLSRLRYDNMRLIGTQESRKMDDYQLSVYELRLHSQVMLHRQCLHPPELRCSQKQHPVSAFHKTTLLHASAPISRSVALPALNAVVPARARQVRSPRRSHAERLAVAVKASVSHVSHAQGTFMREVGDAYE